MFYLSDDVPLFNPTNITQARVPTATVADVRDVVRQDALIGSYFRNSLSNADTDVTYVTQYTTPSTASLATSLAAGDVILSAFSQDPTSTQHVFAKPVRPPPIRTTKIFHRLNPNTPMTQFNMINPLIANQKDVKKNVQIRGQVPTTRSICTKTLSRNLIKAGLHTEIRPPARISVVRNTSRGLSNRPKHQSILLISRGENASPSTRIGLVKPVTHTVTNTVDSVSESPLSFASETNTTTPQTFSWTNLAATQNPTLHSPSAVTSTITSQIVSNSRAVATTVATQSTFALPIYPSPMIIAPPSRDTSAKTLSTTSKEGHDGNEITNETTSCTKSPSSTSESLRILSPTFISQTKTRVCAMRPVPNTLVVNTHTVTPAVTSAIRRPYAVVPTRSTCAIPPGATLYAPTTTPSGKPSRLRAVPITTACQRFAIDNGMGSYTTLTISPDVTQTTTLNSVPTPQTTATTTVAEPDAPVRSRSQLLIPIASTSTGISYLMTSTISSFPEETQAQSATTFVDTHIRSDVPNRTRTRFILPVAQNMATSVVGSPSDSIKTRNTLAIISPQISSTLDSSGNPGIGTIRAFAIAKPQNASFLSSNTERVTRSRGNPVLAESSGPPDSDDLTSLTALLTSDLASSAVKTSDSSRPVSRIFMPFIQSASNTQNNVSSGVATRILTPSTYILTSGIGTSANAANTTPKPSQRVVIPLIHSSVTAVTTATTTTARSSSTDFTSPMMAATDETSRLRNRLLVPTVSASVDSDCTDNSASTSSITAYTITRGRTPLSSVPMQSGLSRSSESFNPLSSSTTHNMFAANTAFISFATTTVASTVTSSQSPVSSTVPSADPSSSQSSSMCLLTTATPTLTSTGHRYVIKLASHSTSSTSVGTVSSTTSAPVTTSTISTAEHQLVESASASRLRTFPGPRTYSVAQRNVSKSERTVSPRPTSGKRIVTAPAPLQIFPEIVCPQSMSAPTHNLGQSGQRFTLSQSSGSSTLIVPQYKNTVFKNLSTIAHPIPSGTRLPNAVSTERFILKRSVTCVTPRRSFPSTTLASKLPQGTRADSQSHSSPQPSNSPDTSGVQSTTQSAKASDTAPPAPNEQLNENT